MTSYNPSADFEFIKKAYVFSAMVHQGQSRMSGEPYLNHPLGVAHILAGMEMDAVTVATGLLHDTVEDTRTSLDDIRGLFGDETATLVDGLTKLSKVTFDHQKEREAENFRKILVAMAKDIRIIVIKLADRLHNMRTLDYLPPERQKKVAQETIDIYAPLAHRLGIGWVKMELEELAFKYLNPVEHSMILTKLAKEDDERQRYIHEVKEVIEKKLAEHGLKAVVSGRSKHLYSIYKKIEHERVDLEHIYDIVGFRIIVDTIKECYETLGIVHSAWKPIPGRFKDYIALPKSNMYQSIHTAVIGPHQERMEVQIRTHDMHRVAEDGIASHWRYKGGVSADHEEEKQFGWLRQLLDWQKEMKDAGEFIETLKVDLFPDDVFVFTPMGDIKELPVGATVIDYAYAIHTDIGDRCTGARVNGKVVPLHYRLRNGDMVEVTTSQNHNPSKEWLKYAVTSRAKTKIRQWIKTEERTRSIALGREICEKEFKKHGLDFNEMLTSGEIERISREGLGIASLDKLLTNIGYGKLSVSHLMSKVLKPERLMLQPIVGLSKFVRLFHKGKKRHKDAVAVKGVEDVLIKYARCCNPLPGDEIVGFMTGGEGVVIHMRDCPNILSIDS
ncbi:MAG: RelA/SpoT family protein, partial [Thermodesulfobacteriota bacterium]